MLILIPFIVLRIQEEIQMATISLTRDIKLTTADAEKILNSKPSEPLQALLQSMKPTKSNASNKLIAQYLEKQ